MSNEALIESSTRILYSVNDLSGDLQVYWSKYQAFYFSSSSQSEVRQSEIMGASFPLKNQEEAVTFFKTLSRGERVWTIASFKLVIDQAMKINNWIGQRDLKILIDKLSLKEDLNLIEENYNKIKNDFIAYQNRKTFTVSGSISIIVIDYILRCLLLIIGNTFSFKDIIVSNFFTLIPLLVYATWRAKKDRKFNEQLIDKNSQGGLHKIRFNYSTLQYTVIGFFVLSGATIFGLLVSDDQMDFVLTILILFVLILYYASLLSFFPRGRLSDESLLKQVHEANEDSFLDVDQNDEAIVLLETDLNSNTGRLEAYVLESTLFGALAFSGFLQIIATDLISFNDLEKFASTCFQLGHGLVNSNWNEFDQSIGLLNSKVSLFCLVSIETLTCSILFLAVIASRLLFSNVADKVRTALNLAKAYNEKEETLLENPIHDEKTKIRLTSLTEKISVHLKDARRHISGVDPIVDYMVYFRNAGLLTFLMVLISSSLFISSALSWTYITVGIGTLVYFNIKSLRANAFVIGIRIRIFIARHSWIIFISTIIVLLSGYCLRVFLKLDGTDPLLALSYIMGGLYCFIWITLMPHSDKIFGTIETSNGSQNNRWQIIKNYFGIAVLLSSIGFSFKVLEWSGADEMLIIGFFSLSIINYFFFPYLTRPKWVSFIVAFIIQTSYFAILFWIQNWYRLRELNVMAIFLIPLIFIIYLFRRKTFHHIIIRISLISALFAFLLPSSLPLFSPAIITRLRIIYDHKTINIKSILSFGIDLLLPDNPKFDKTVFQSNLDKSNQYIETYGKQFGKTTMYKHHFIYFDDVASAVLLWEDSPKLKKDTVLLNIALRSTIQMNKITTLFGYYDLDGVDLHTEALKSLGRKEEARTFLQNVIRIENDKGVIKEAKKQLKSLN